MNVGVIGCGGWGKIVARRCSLLFNLVGVFDSCTATSTMAADVLGSVSYLSESDLIKRSDAIVIATPSHSDRMSILRKCVQYGVSQVRIEKPLHADLAQAREMYLFALETGLELYVGYTASFNDGVAMMTTSLSCLEGPYTGTFKRLSSVPARHGSSPFIDLAPHDIATAAYITGELPDHVEKRYQDSAVVRFDGGSVFRFEASWDSNDKQRLAVVSRGDTTVFHDEIRGSVDIVTPDGIDYLQCEVGQALDKDLLLWESGASWMDLDVAICNILDQVTCGDRQENGLAI